MGARYLEFAMELRKQMERRDLSVRQLHILLDEKVPVMSIYQWVYGMRIPQPWQLKFLEKRMSFDVPYEFLMGLDRHGVQKKDRQLTLPGLRELRK
jgi:hypothetical protein